MLREAILQTLFAEMERDENVVVLGEDIVGGMGTEGGPEAIGGIWGTSTGLYDKFGGDRVIDTPISESAIIGAAGGLGLTGKRPVAEIMFADFLGVCMIRSGTRWQNSAICLAVKLSVRQWCE